MIRPKLSVYTPQPHTVKPTAETHRHKMELCPHCVLILNVWKLIFSLTKHSLSYWELFSLSSQTGFVFGLSFDHALKLYFVFWVGKKLQQVCYVQIQTSYPPPTCIEIHVHFLPLLVNTGMKEFSPFCSSFVFHESAACHCCFLSLPRPGDQGAAAAAAKSL